ncbi:transposase [Leuconostoc citreum]
MVKKDTQKFKDSIVELAQSGKPLKEIHTEYGVWPESVRSWIKKANHSGPYAPDNLKLIALKKENKRLQEELRILKVAAVLLAKN